MARPKRDNLEREIFSVRIDTGIARQYRHMAIDMRVSLSELVERALRQYNPAPNMATPRPDTTPKPVPATSRPDTPNPVPAQYRRPPVQKSPYDWPSLWSEYQAMKALDANLSQRTFAKIKGIDNTVVSRHFKRIHDNAPDTPPLKQIEGLPPVVGTVKAD